MIDVWRLQSEISVSGFTEVEVLADRQSGPTCGFEAIENIIQLFRMRDNTLSSQLIAQAQRLGCLVLTREGPVLEVQGYRRLLSLYDIPARWYPFLHLEAVIPALINNHGVLVVGDAHQLDPRTYPAPCSWHAFTLTNYYRDPTDQFLVGYVGIDSNFPGTVRAWTVQQVDSAARMAAQYFSHSPVLITERRAGWPRTAPYYRQQYDGQIVAVRQ